MAEIVYEKSAAVWEATRGTAVTPPDHNLGIELMPQIKQEWKELKQKYGVQSASTADPVLVRTGAEWDGSGDLNINLLPFWLNMFVKGGVTAPVANNKVVASVPITAGGSGYTGTPIITFSGGTPILPARGHAVLTGGVITSIVVDNPGLGYASVPTAAITVPGGGTGGTLGTVVLATPTTAKLWQFTRSTTTDDIKTATLYWGDPNMAQIFQTTYSTGTELAIKGAPTGTDLVNYSAKGFAQFLNAVSPPTFPALLAAIGAAPQGLQVWIEPTTATSWQDTEIVGTVLDASATIMTNAVEKFAAQGPAGTKSFTRIGRKEGDACKLSLTVDLQDLTQYTAAVAANDTRRKVAIRWNGPAIETAGGVIFYYFFELNLLGKLAVQKWGAYETNRTLDIDVTSSYDGTSATDLTAFVQCLATSP